MFLKLRAFLVIFLIFASQIVSAETFRVRKVHVLNLADSLEEQSAKIGINDSVALNLPEDRTFYQGIEINVQIPESVYQWRDSVACSIYDGITPRPSESQIDYSGQKIFVSPLPSKVSWILQIPLLEKNFIKESVYTSKVNVIPDVSKNYTFVRFQPAMKGVPEETINAELQVSVKPIFIDKGRLNLKINSPSGDAGNETYNIFIDDKPVSFKNPEKSGNSIIDSFILDTGVHNLSVQSSEYRNEVRSIVIDQARTTECVIDFKSLAPTLVITAPDVAKVFLDDQPVTEKGKEFVISEGEHKVRFLMGDYEVIRSLSVQKGKSYTANLSVDLQILEE